VILISEKKSNDQLKYIELLADSARSQIFCELLIHKQLTTTELLKKIAISKGTMSYHLSKLVNSGLLEVKVQATGRPLKTYNITKNKLMIKDNKMGVFSSSTAQLQMLANTMKNSISKVDFSNLEKYDDCKFYSTMLFLKPKQTDFLQNKLAKFIDQTLKELSEIKDDSDDGGRLHLFSTVLFPFL